MQYGEKELDRIKFRETMGERFPNLVKNFADSGSLLSSKHNKWKQNLGT